MALHGSLETIQLADVLTMLATSGKTGELRVAGLGIEGSLWLESGQLVGYEGAPYREPVEAVFDLLRVPVGMFLFEAGERPKAPVPPIALRPLVDEAVERLDEWRGIEETVPSPDHLVSLAPKAPSDEVRLSADAWRLVVAVAESETVGGVVEALNLEELTVCAGLRDLVDDGLVTISAPNDGFTHRWLGDPEPKEAPEAEAEAEPEPEPEPEVADAPAPAPTPLVAVSRREAPLRASARAPMPIPPQARDHLHGAGTGTSWAQAAGTAEPRLTGDDLERAMTFTDPTPLFPPVAASVDVEAEDHAPAPAPGRRSHRLKLRHL